MEKVRQAYLRALNETAHFMGLDIEFDIPKGQTGNVTGTYRFFDGVNPPSKSYHLPNLIKAEHAKYEAINALIHYLPRPR